MIKDKDIQKVFWFRDKYGDTHVAYQNTTRTRWFQLKANPTKYYIINWIKLKIYPIICQLLCTLRFERDKFKS